MILGYFPAAKLQKNKRYRALQEDICLFVKHSAAEACEVDVSPYKDGKSAHAAYYNAVKRYGVENLVSVQMRSGRLFLVKKGVSENA